MSSAQRSFSQKQQALTRFLKLESPSYNDGHIRLFPFTVSNGILDISYEGNNFKTIMVDVLNVGPDDETDSAYTVMSGPRIVHSIGNNFKDYIRSWRDGTIDAGSPINVYAPCQVLRVQEGDYNNITANSGASYVISTEPPASDNYISGTATNSYLVSYVFKTPLTITILEGGVLTYITFRSYFDQE
jgi:hypothetical protein